MLRVAAVAAVTGIAGGGCALADEPANGAKRHATTAQTISNPTMTKTARLKRIKTCHGTDCEPPKRCRARAPDAHTPHTDISSGQRTVQASPHDKAVMITRA